MLVVGNKGEYIMTVGRLRRPKGRTLTTYQNKVNRLGKLYRRLYRESKNRKEKLSSLSREQKVMLSRKGFFCDKFPDEKSFLSKYKLKEVNVK